MQASQLFCNPALKAGMYGGKASQNAQNRKMLTKNTWRNEAITQTVEARNA